MNIKKPLLADVINVCTPIQDIQIIDKTTNDVIAEGPHWELRKLFNEYGDCEVYIMRVHRETLTIVIKP